MFQTYSAEFLEIFERKAGVRDVKSSHAVALFLPLLFPTVVLPLHRLVQADQLQRDSACLP